MGMTDKFEFVELPQHGRGSRGPDKIIIDFAEALCARPGQWAKYPRPLTRGAAASYTTRINHPRPHETGPNVLKTGEFEAATRDGQLYVRMKPTEEA